MGANPIRRSSKPYLWFLTDPFGSRRMWASRQVGRAIGPPETSDRRLHDNNVGAAGFVSLALQRRGDLLGGPDAIRHASRHRGGHVPAEVAVRAAPSSTRSFMIVFLAHRPCDLPLTRYAL